MSVPPEIRSILSVRAKGRCEYCHALEVIMIKLEAEHIYPESLGGETTLENLCLSCRFCNGFKSAKVSGVDPLTGETTPLFHPRLEKWADHFAWDEDATHLIGLTPVGRATIDQLKMNRPEVIASRIVWKLTGLHPPPD